MKVSLHHKNNSKIVRLFILALMVTLCSTAIVYADDENIANRPSLDRVTIEKKRVDAVVSNVGRAYAVNRETIILNKDGKQVSIRHLLVPCVAEVTYDFDQGTPKAKRIAVLRAGNGKKWQWGAKVPE